jgi:hypothetical protein
MMMMMPTIIIIIIIALPVGKGQRGDWLEALQPLLELARRRRRQDTRYGADDEHRTNRDGLNRPLRRCDDASLPARVGADPNRTLDIERCDWTPDTEHFAMNVNEHWALRTE